MNENGYRLDDEGNLFRIPPDLHDTSLGPAFYDISEVSFGDVIEIFNIPNIASGSCYSKEIKIKYF